MRKQESSKHRSGHLGHMGYTILVILILENDCPNVIVCSCLCCLLHGVIIRNIVIMYTTCLLAVADLVGGGI